MNNSNDSNNSSDSTAENQVFLLAGGRPSGGADMSRLMSLALGEKPKPLVAYIGTANGDNVLFFARMKKLLTDAGAGKVVLVHIARQKINIDTVKQTLTDADVVFLSGGEVEDGIDWLDRHGLSEFLRELYNGGKRFVGISAGSIMLGAYWARWKDPDDDDTAALFECLGIVPVVFDTHAEDEDWKELKTVLRLLGDGTRGYGIQSGGMTSGYGSGKLVDIEKTVLAYINEGGSVRRV